MSVDTLRFAPWQAKAQLSPTKYESLTVAVSRFLFHALSLPDIKLDIAWAQAFVRVYAQDAARHVLQVLDDGEEYNEAIPSAQELAIRALTLRLSGRLAKISGGLSISTLVDLAIVYGAANTTSVQTLYSESFKSTPALLQGFEAEVLPALTTGLQAPDRRHVYVLAQLLHCSSQVALLFVEDTEFLVGLARSYQAGLDSLAASHGGMVLDARNSVEPWQKKWLYTKTGLLDTFHAMVQALLQSPLPKHADHLFNMLFAILDLPSSSDTQKTPFISQSLLADYQYTFDLSSVLREKFQDNDDARVDLLAATLDDLSPAPRGPKPAGVLSILLSDNARSHDMAVVPVADSKGKARAAEQEPQHDGALDLAVSQVLDIFPTEMPHRIRRGLKHPVFGGDPEKLISALLEGTLPPELADESVAEEVPQKEFEYTKDRRNVWDDDAMDYSRLRIGKTRGDADKLLQDRAFVEQMKADIIRRVEELSDDEEVVRDRRERTVPFEEEQDDDLESLIDKGVKVAGDGEDSGDSDGEGNAGEPATSSPETILALAYIEDPKLFDRDAATRRSKPRQDLKARTGWGDEQIEGWRIMLERNPKKDKILQKHEFSGNALLVPNTNSSEPGPSGSSRGRPSSRGRGSGGRGRGHGGGHGGGGGGGGGGGEETARDRARKDKNKARQGNHNRKRGHDKKMARGGGGAPV